MALRQTTEFVESLLHLISLNCAVPDFRTQSRRQKPREVRAVESSLANATGPKKPVVGGHIGDAPVLPDFLSQIPASEVIGSVIADAAYDTRKCHDAIADRGANAVIPPGKKAKPWKAVTAGAVARIEALRASKYLGRAN